MARVFENKEGDWEKVEKQIKEAKKQISVLQDLLNKFSKGSKELEAVLLEAYKFAPKVDALYYDCPISPSMQIHHLKANLFKHGWRGIRDINANAIDIKDFSEEMDKALNWLIKYKNETKN